MIPDLDIAKKLINNVCKITNELNEKMGLSRGISRIHYKNVAFCAQKIAKKCGMDYQKAYILGLLHDYGEYIEDTVEGTFHGTAGYDEMLKMGYDDVARICLTHSFWEDIYDPEYFTYHSSEIIRAKEIISDLVCDDYDKLIQLSDLMSCGDKIVNVGYRIDWIAKKYKLDTSKSVLRKEKAIKLKQYFDKKCKQDVYKIVGIK
ncbi:MAG: HD domain-containing protein [Alphaproteobacteria bacterium]|nr:HD domain-containing protein [Alphaproteobacteria bacterium]